MLIRQTNNTCLAGYLKTLVRVFVMCRLDSCNNFIIIWVTGEPYPKSLTNPKLCCMTYHERELHWLVVNERESLNVLLFTYKAQDHLAPLYIHVQDLLTIYSLSPKLKRRK